MGKPLRSVLMSGGQGDAVMGACGLHAFLAPGFDGLAPDAVVYARSVASLLVGGLLEGIAVKSLGEGTRPPKPRYYTSAGTSWSTVLRNWFGADWHVNFAEARRRASTGYPPPGASRRHVALMSHDLPVHPMHPAAPSQIVFEAMPCVPYHYVNRDVQPRCMAGREWCGVFASASYLAAARGALDHARATP